MKTLILFYSYTDKTRALAEALAAEESCAAAEVKDNERPGVIKAYTLGCFAAIKGKAWPIQPLSVNLAEYDRFILFIPVWAGNPPPAANAALSLLPHGKTVLIKMVSASGKSKCVARIEAELKAKGCVLEGFEDVKA